MDASPGSSRLSVAGVVTVVFSMALLWAAVAYPDFWTLPDGKAASALAPAAAGFLKLAIAAAIGALVTNVRPPASRRHKSTLPVAHAQILFCVAGALVMIIIGDSLARAFGAFGVTSTVRFRTPIKDPEDATVLFLLIGLGMSVGRGLLSIAAVGTVFVWLLLYILDRRTARSSAAGFTDATTLEAAAHAHD